MAESQESAIQDTKTVLQWCAQNLLNAVQLLNNCNTHLPDQSLSNNNRLPNFWLLFGYRPPNPRSSCLQSRGSSKKRVVIGKNGRPIAITVKDTRTHSFVCLSNTRDDMAYDGTFDH